MTIERCDWFMKTESTAQINSNGSKCCIGWNWLKSNVIGIHPSVSFNLFVEITLNVHTYVKLKYRKVLQIRSCKEKIWRSHMTNTPKRQTMHRWNYTKTLKKRSITQRLRTDLGRSYILHFHVYNWKNKISLEHWTLIYKAVGDSITSLVQLTS